MVNFNQLPVCYGYRYISPVDFWIMALTFFRSRDIGNLVCRILFTLIIIIINNKTFVERHSAVASEALEPAEQVS